MRKVFLLLSIVLLFSGGVPAEPGRFAYVLKYDGMDEYLIEFDVNTDSIVKEIRLPGYSGFNNFVVDEKGGCFISKFRTTANYFNEIYYYGFGSEIFSRFVNLGNIFGPHYLVLTKDELIARVYGNKEME